MRKGIYPTMLHLQFGSKFIIKYVEVEHRLGENYGMKCRENTVLISEAKRNSFLYSFALLFILPYSRIESDTAVQFFFLAFFLCFWYVCLKFIYCTRSYDHHQYYWPVVGTDRWKSPFTHTKNNKQWHTHTSSHQSLCESQTTHLHFTITKAK